MFKVNNTNTATTPVVDFLRTVLGLFKIALRFHRSVCFHVTVTGSFELFDFSKFK